MRGVLSLTKEGSVQVIDFHIDGCPKEYISIYESDLVKYKLEDWPEGFWYCPDWPDQDDLPEYTEVNKEYHDHRDYYIQEAKKLLIKEML